MSTTMNSIPPNFTSSEEAFEYLIRQSQNQILKKQWAIELSLLPDLSLQKKAVVNKKSYNKVLAFFLGFIVLMGILYWFSNRNNTLQQMAEVMLKETKFVLHHSALTRGIKELETDQLDVALQREINRALEFEDFEASIGLFRTKEKQTQLSVDDKFYYSLSLGRVRNGDYYKAIRMLDDVIQQKDRFYSEALWLQALLYLKINEPAKAKIILNKLISTSNYHYQITNIRMLLERLAES